MQTFKPGVLIEATLQGQPCGDGYRRLLVLTVGPKFTTLLYLPTVTLVHMDNRDLGRNRTARPAEDANPRALRRILRNNVRERKQNKLRFSTRAAKLAAELLEAAR